MGKRKKKTSVSRRLIKHLLLAGFSFALLFILFIVFVKAGWFGCVPAESDLKRIQNETATLVYSSDDVLLGKYFDKNRTRIERSDVPEHLMQALIATEDARFYSHEGIDTRSYFRVFFKTLLLNDESSGGGSTITQQLAKNLFGRSDFALLTLPVNKVKEAVIARRLEEVYNKQEILMLYLNTVPFGENVYGVEAAANRYFNKSAQALTTPESATLVGLLKANTYYNPRLHPENAKERRNLVLSLMQRQDYISEKEKDEYQKVPLQVDYSNYSLKGPANYFLYQVKQQAKTILQKYERRNGVSYDLEKDGLKIHTYLHAGLQEMVKESIRTHLRRMQEKLDLELKGRKTDFIPALENDSPKKREVFTWKGVEVNQMTKRDSLWHYKKMLHAAALIANPESGKVRVWVGGNHHRYLPFDLVRARRPSASAFKPILYTAALEEGYDVCTYLDNKKKVYKRFDDWEPQNYDLESGGEVAMWYALANSMNIPTVDLYFKTGHEALDYIWRKMGFRDALPAEPAVALGAKEVSLAGLVQGYSVFANKGRVPQLKMIKRIENGNGEPIYQASETDAEKAVEPETAEKITAMLSRAAREGTGASLYGRYGVHSDFAAKTGTSEDFKDARFMCYNRDMVLGVWVGARDPEIHFRSGNYGSGAALALPIAGKAIKKMQKDPELRNEYLSPVNLAVDTSQMMSCPPLKEEGPIEGFLKDVTDGIKSIFKKKDSSRKNEKPDTEKPKEKDGKFKKLINKIFGKEKKKKQE